ncbi:hypothetical protein [Aquibacillus salsiterrae]|nr:hypothetical protein [Aquibacillus salsiterrae]
MNSEKYANLSDKELERISQLEDELGVILIAYDETNVNTTDVNNN